MLYKQVFTIILALMPLICFSQKHDYNWIWGYDNASNDAQLGGAAMNFHSSPPTIYLDKRKTNMDFYCGVCSDSSGILEFYTNGMAIRDTTHEIMLHGDHLNPGIIWDEWTAAYPFTSYPNGPFCFALPAPGKHKEYYFFHLATTVNYHSCPFYYTIINMNGNNGLGEVTQKNQIILPGSDTDERDYIDPVAVKHGNGRDWWIITGGLYTPFLYTFLLDSEGVHGPFTTEMPYQFPGTEYQSVNAMSPNGNTYIRAAGRLGLYIYDFDRCSGTFGNLNALPFANHDFLCFATAFAPNSKYLYLSSWETLMVLDLSAPDISASLDTLAYFDGKASPQEPFLTGFWNPNLGPDEKIYYATTNSTLSMHVIHQPDLPGQAADVEQHGLTLPKFNNGTMCLFPNYRLGEWEGSPCDTLHAQQTGDGFVKSAWYPPAYTGPEGYTLLPPLFPPAPPGSGQVRERVPNMAELAARRAAARGKVEVDKKIDKQ